jgi:hypothetical protein
LIFRFISGERGIEIEKTEGERVHTRRSRAMKDKQNIFGRAPFFFLAAVLVLTPQAILRPECGNEGLPSHIQGAGLSK